MLFRSPKPQTPNPKPQTPNPVSSIMSEKIKNKSPKSKKDKSNKEEKVKEAKVETKVIEGDKNKRKLLKEKKQNEGVVDGSDSQRELVVRSKAKSLQEEIAANRSHNLNFKSSFDTTAPPVFPPPAFSNDFSFSSPPQNKQYLNTEKDDPLFDGKDNILKNDIGENSINWSGANEPSYPNGSSGRKTADFFANNDRESKGSVFSFQNNEGSRGKGPSFSSLPQPQLSRGNSFQKPAAQVIKRDKIPQNPGSLAYRLFKVPKDEMPKDALDEYIRDERKRELDFMEMNKKYNEVEKIDKRYNRRLEELKMSGSLGLGPVNERPKRMNQLEDLFQNRGVIDITDVVHNLPYNSTNISSQRTPLSSRLGVAQTEKPYYNPRTFGQRLAEGAIRLRDYDTSTPLTVFL